MPWQLNPPQAVEVCLLTPLTPAFTLVCPFDPSSESIEDQERRCHTDERKGQLLRLQQVVEREEREGEISLLSARESDGVSRYDSPWSSELG